MKPLRLQGANTTPADKCGQGKKVRGYSMNRTDRIEVMAPAKINLALDVTGVRPNGYHDVRMIMQSIRLCDKVSLKAIAKKEIILKNSHAFLPTGKGNLAYDAAELFLAKSGIDSGVFIEVEKNIPIAAGLAGGSTDAAAVLCGLNELFETGYSEEALREMGLSLGADVPFCIMGGTALAEGIGEELTRLPAAPSFYVVLVKPETGVSTKEVYTRLSLEEATAHPDVDGMLAAIRAGDRDGMLARLGNVLEPVSRQICPEIADIEAELKSLGANGVLMSGSGPTVFGLFTDQTLASLAFKSFKAGRYARQTFLTEFLHA